MRRLLLILLLVASPLGAQSLRPGNTCDIAQFPAATLPLPYFEVDLNAPPSVAQTTLFTVVNASRQPQIANITVWSDWGFPVLTFPVYLTGYDAEAYNLYDVVARGIIASTSSGTTPGSHAQAANPRFLPSVANDCATAGGVIPQSLLADVRSSLTTGIYSACGSMRVGGTHANAIGYITIDLVASCRPLLPNTTAYYDLLLYDNVLTGDYQQVSPNPATGNYAAGNPLVHIRAVPEGGSAGAAAATNLPYTFYDRYTPRGSRQMDRRQPLPSLFAARYIQGGATAFQTAFSIWREGVDPVAASCSAFVDNALLLVTDLVRFDERENPTTLPGSFGIPEAPVYHPSFPATSRTPTTSSVFPLLTSSDVAGWIYLDLHNGGSSNYSGNTTAAARPSQSWVTSVMSAEGRYSTETNATSLGNGCSPARPFGAPAGPAANVNP